MKKLLFTMLIAASLSGNAQITFEHTYSGSNNPGINIIQLANSGYKYCRIDITDTITLYDLTHAVYKTIVLPPLLPNYHYGAKAEYISETLFNNDNLIEYVYTVYTIPPPTSNLNTTVYVVNENGTVLFNKYLGHGAGVTLKNAGSQFKLCLIDSASNISIYSLPGTIPCDLCGGYAGIAPQNGGAGERMSGLTSQPMPNPSDGNTIIKYNLPAGANRGEVVIYNLQGTQVKTYTVDRTFDSLVLSNTDLAAGTYFYQLKAGNGFSDTKKMFIIK